ncbi:MAG TPA: DUF459 domain-containing protein [Acidimicrobiales bacterium]|nr:DUF459 domain-containing protein [Acidimicrobiales bacterium]
MARAEPPLRVDPEPAGDDDEHPHLASHRPVAAGHVLLVMLAGLLLGAFLNADRMAERAEQKSFDDPWRGPSVALWGGLEAVADAVGLTRPRQAIEGALGPDHPGSSDADVEDLVDQRSARAAARQDAPPTIRTPSAARPLRLYLGGDSMARSFGIALQRVAGTTGIITPTIDHRVVSGLSRPDYFNWPQHLAEDVVATDPEVMVLLFGANDAQSLRLDDGTICRRFERCWIEEYRRRVAGTMDLLRDPDGDRIVVWLGQPIMGPASGVDHVDLLNAIYEAQAEERPWVRYVDTWSWFVQPDGSYSAFLPAADGSEHRVREPDDVHLTAAGGERLSWALLRLLGDGIVDLSAWAGEPPPDALPPDRPRPRTDLPDPEPRLVD